MSKLGVPRGPYAKVGSPKRNRAEQLHQLGLSHKEIADAINSEFKSKHTPGAIRLWVDPQQKAANNKDRRDWYWLNAEAQKEQRRAYSNTELGKLNSSKKAQRRRALKYGMSTFVQDIGIIDMSDYLDSSVDLPPCYDTSEADRSAAELSRLGKKLTELTGVAYQVDHMVPLASGGEHCKENLQLVTKKYNLKKGDTLIESDTRKFSLNMFGYYPNGYTVPIH
jgi:hypothetical protein